MSDGGRVAPRVTPPLSCGLNWPAIILFLLTGIIFRGGGGVLMGETTRRELVSGARVVPEAVLRRT